MENLALNKMTVGRYTHFKKADFSRKNSTTLSLVVGTVCFFNFAEIKEGI